MKKVLFAASAMALLASSSVASAQLHPPGGSCGGTSEYYQESFGNTTITHYPNGTFVTTVTLTDPSTGQTSTFVVDSGPDLYPRNAEVNC